MTWTVDAALAQGRAAGLARLDAQLLLAHLVGRDRTWLIAHGDHRLDDGLRGAWESALQRRLDGEPLAYLTGVREFRGLPLAVDARVLVPRPETEHLVDWALERLAALGDERPVDVIDLGTGSGAIALAIGAAWPQARIVATDTSRAALEVAAANARRLGQDPLLRQGAWWDAVPAPSRFHLAVSNPPYIAGTDPHLAALRHEPREALTPGGDGLADLFSIIDEAGAHLHADGWLLLEHGHDQHGAVRERLEIRGYRDVDTRRDLAGLPRCTGGRWPGA